MDNAYLKCDNWHLPFEKRPRKLKLEIEQYNVCSFQVARARNDSTGVNDIYTCSFCIFVVSSVTLLIPQWKNS